MTPFARQRRRSETDSGYALLTVIGLGTAIVLAVSAVGGYALQTMDSAGRSQGFHAAIQAAQAGVDDYVSRYNATANSASPYTPDPGQWRLVPGSTDGNGAPCGTDVLAAPPNCPTFRQVVSGTPGTQNFSVVSVGRSRGTERAVQVQLKQRAITDYLYFSELETVDPKDRLIYNGVLASPTAPTDPLCTSNAWSSPRPDKCIEPVFRTGDSLTGGRVHTNDVFQLAGSPDLGDRVSTAWPQCEAAPEVRQCYRQASGSGPEGLAEAMTYDPTLSLPATENLKAAAGQINGTRKGCVFKGPTRIKLNDNGTMTVWSPLTPADPPGTPAAQQCIGTSDPLGPVKQLINSLNVCLPIVGCPALGTLVNNVLNLLPVSAGVTVPVPTGNVIYVEDAAPPSGALGEVVCRLGKTLGLSGGTLQPNLGSTVSESCSSGSLVVDGVLDGELTLGAQDNVLIANDITYKGGLSGDDRLGLVAGGSVEVINPLVNPQDLLSLNVLNYLLNPFTRRIDASILALGGRFGVQLSQVALTLGQPKLVVNGSIGQKYAGFVGGKLNAGPVLDLATVSTSLNVGFTKDYNYDPRLRSKTPPGFPAATGKVYDPQSFAEVDVPA